MKFVKKCMIFFLAFGMISNYGLIGVPVSEELTVEALTASTISGVGNSKTYAENLTWKPSVGGGDSVTYAEDLTWTLDNKGTLTISGTGAMPEWDEGASPWQSDKAGEIKSVIIQDGLTSIGGFAFADCQSLTSVSIPSSVTSIGWNAFSECSSLTSVVIPSGVTRIRYHAFRNCTNLDSITIENPDCEIYDWSDTISNYRDDSYNEFLISYGGYFNGTIYGYPNSTAQAYAEKYGCDFESISGSETTTGNSGTCGQNLTWTLDDAGTLTISGTGTMFEWDEGASPWQSDKAGEIKSVIIEDGVTNIGGFAFADCQSLTSISIPSSVTSIGWNAFSECSSLTSVVIPSGVTRIRYHAFRNCTNLDSITIENPDCEIYDWSDTISNYRDDSYNEFLISYGGCFDGTIYGYPNSTAQAYAEKYGCDFESISGSETTTGNSGTCGQNLTWTLDDAGTLTISGTGAMIDDWHNEHLSPWAKNDNIKTVIIEDGVTNIGGWAFFLCSNLTSVTIPDSITSIEPNAFKCCYNLISIDIPDSVTSIGYQAFHYCYSLPSIIIPDTITSIGMETFSSCFSLTSIDIPDSVTYIGEGAFSYCENLTTVIIRCPYCEIWDDSVISNGIDDDWNIYFNGTIYGYPNSSAQIYAETCGYDFEPLDSESEELQQGDINGDHQIDAEDAALILRESAAIGSGLEATFTSEQNNAADINHDHQVDAEDASMILVYSAAVGSGQTALTIEEYFNR